MKVICIGNFPPRQCGIATFTENLVRSILQAADSRNFKFEIEIIAMNDAGRTYAYPSIVSCTIADNYKDDYIRMADYINQSGAALCLVQHEYGIYGGESGLLLLAMLRRIKIPIVSTLHTVLEKPTFHQKEVLKKIAFYSSRVVVMNNMAIDFLTEVFDVQREKIIRIQHGVPDFSQLENQYLPPPISWKNRCVMLTFGLIGRSKGIETVLRALPSVVKQHPDLLYVVLGKTHPSIVRQVGEEYREFLLSLVRELDLQDNVEFMDRYVSELELVSYLKAADLYVTPYLNKAQITSGTLSYAVGGGCAVISTPYWHAEELLADGRGRLFDFADSNKLAEIIHELIIHPNELAHLQQNAFEYGKSISWPKIGDAYVSLFQEVIHNFSSERSVIPDLDIPLFDLSHFHRLTDNTGILQHARLSVPYFKTGYCLDDNARALILCLAVWNRSKEPSLIGMMHIYLSYILFMQQKNGSFRNYLSYGIKGTDDDYSEDALGRAIWATGCLVRNAPTDSLFQIGHQLFGQSIEQLSRLRYARGFANGIFGIVDYIKRFPDQERYLILLESLADQLCDQFFHIRREGWDWFEESITYDNGLLPGALYRAYEVLRNEKYLQVADASRTFLESKCFREDWLSLIGNRKWLRMDDDFDLYAQQPIDALSMVILYESAFQATGNREFIDRMITSFKWFLGYNDLDISVYDADTKGCNDGIEEYNINRNQGAESTIAFLLSQYIVESYLP
jgi:glycosyltransferase involved in cell wall biosynthesis